MFNIEWALAECSAKAGILFCWWPLAEASGKFMMSELASGALTYVRAADTSSLFPAAAVVVAVGFGGEGLSFFEDRDGREGEGGEDDQDRN